MLVGLVLAWGCAASGRKADPGPATTATPGVTAPPAQGARIKDSVPERSAGLNAADRDLQEGATEERFGFEEARARREAAKKSANARADGGTEPGLGSNGSLTPSPRQ